MTRANQLAVISSWQCKEFKKLKVSRKVNKLINIEVRTKNIKISVLEISKRKENEEQETIREIREENFHKLKKDISHQVPRQKQGGREKEREKSPILRHECHTSDYLKSKDKEKSLRVSGRKNRNL